MGGRRARSSTRQHQGRVRLPGRPAALTTLRTMAVTDKSMYLDPTDSEYANLFNSGKIGMLVTGPWDLSGFPNVKYGVQIMPSFPGTTAGIRPSPDPTTG